MVGGVGLMAALSNVTAQLRRAGMRSLEAKDTLFRNVWRGLHPDESSTPLFIVGCNRSGTTMLTFQLAKSWQVVAFNENNPEAFSEFHLRHRDHIAAILQEGRAPWAVFKPVLDTHRVGAFLESFPEGRALFVYRNVDDVVNSLLRKAQLRGHTPKQEQIAGWLATDFEEIQDPEPAPVTKVRIGSLWHPNLNEESAAALFWLFQNSHYFDLGLDQDPRIKLVRYEELVADPQAAFAEISGFMGIQSDPRFGRGVHQSSVRKHPRPDLAAKIREACTALLHRLDAARA